MGFYAGLSGPNGLAYHPLAPAKLFDTRLGIGAFPPQKLASKHSLGVSLVRAFGGDPANLPKVVVLSVTAVGATSNGSVNAFHYSAAKPPTPTYAPGAPVVAFNTGIQTSNLVTYSLDGGTQVWFYNNASGAVHLRVDVVGGFVTPTNGPDGVPTATGRFVPVTPTRLLDTRTPGAGGPVSVGTPRAVTAAPTAPVSAGAIAVVGNLTVFAATDEADIAAHAADQCPAPDIVLAHTLPGFSVPVATMPTLSLTTACSAVAGQFLVWGTSTAATPPQFNMVFDLAGWFRP